MKRLTAIAVLMLGLLAANLARAGWHPLNGGLNGGPVDTWIADAGTTAYFAVTTSTNAYRLIENGSGVSIVGSVAVPSFSRCAVIGANDYLRVYGYDQTFTDETPPPIPPTDSGYVIDVCRGSENRAAVGFGTPGGGSGKKALSVDAGAYGGPWVASATTVGGIGVFPDSVSAGTVFGREYGFFPRPSTGSFYMVDGVVPTGFFFGGLGFVGRSELFGARDGGVRVVTVGGDGGQLLTLQPGNILAENFTLPIPGVFAMRGVTISELEGDQFGAGFGMLLVDSSSSSVSNLWSAIPDPDNVGRFWVPSSVPPPPASTGRYDSVRCRDARFCVLGSVYSTGPTGTQLAVYRNASSPSIIQPAFVVNEENTMTQTFTVDAGDDDGDAIFMTWQPDPDAGLYLNPFSRDVNAPDGTRWTGRTVPSTRLCRLDHVDVPVTVFASDGLNKTQSSGNITIIHTRPGAPGNQSTTIQAGLPQQFLTLPFIPNLCPPFGSQVSTVPSNTPNSVTVNASDVVVGYTPPRTWCDVTPGSGTKEIHVQIVDGPAVSQEGIATFVVTPWGEPEPPFGGGSTVFQDAGTTAIYQPSATHLCGDAGTFPGVDTFWTWTATGTGFTPTVLQVDGGQLPPSGGYSATANVSVPDCQTGTIAFQVTNTTRMDGGLTSLDSGFTVNVDTTLQTLAGTLVVDAFPDAGSVTGTLTASGVQCLSRRAITGAVELYGDGGLLASKSGFAVPGPYDVPAPADACSGGTFTVRATAGDSTGGQLVPATANVDLPRLDPGVDTVTVPDFWIACGDVAHSTGTVTFLATQCAAAQVDWTSTGAVAIASASGSPSVNLDTASSDFGGLIGMPVTVRATATTPNGSAGKDAAPALVRAMPFLEVAHRTDTAVASESRVMGVEVRLTNPTACDVSGVEWHEALDGVSWIDGSVTGADGGMVAVPDGGEFVVQGLSIPAHQTVAFRYSARPTLFGAPSPNGVATLRAVPISNRSGLSPGNPTCGCQSGSSGGMALAGLLAAALLRKRRRLRARS